MLGNNVLDLYLSTTARQQCAGFVSIYSYLLQSGGQLNACVANQSKWWVDG